MLDSEVIAAIDKYMQKHGKMPTKICGTFNQLVGLAWLANYTKFMGKDAYVVPLGVLELELDVKADDWYVA